MNSNLQLIDFNHLNSIIGEDENFKKELIGIFLEQIPAFISNMNQFFIKNKLEKLAREAHTAKSSVLIFGMTNTGRLLKEIQLLAENEKTDEIEPALKQVEMDLKQASTDLQNALKKD